MKQVHIYVYVLTTKMRIHSYHMILYIGTETVILCTALFTKRDNVLHRGVVG